MNDTAGDFIASSGSGNQSGTTGATTNAIAKATASNTLGDSDFTNPSTGILKRPDATGTADGNTFTLRGSDASTSGNGGHVIAIGGTGAGGGYTGGLQLGGSGAGYPWIRGKTTDVLEFFKGDASAYCALQYATAEYSAGYTNASNYSANTAGGSYVCEHSGGAGQFKWYTSAYDTGLGRYAAGVVQVTDGSTGQGALLAKRVITAQTADYTVTAAETGTVFTNTGASGTVVFTLPASPADGLTYEFHITAAQSVDIKTGTAVLIYANAAATTATTGKLTENTVGTCIQLTYNGVAWMGTGQSGTWTVS